MEFVYILKSGKIYKIGYTTNPKSRVCTIRSSNPSTKLIALYCASKEDESVLHSLFRDKKVSNEWFALDEFDLQHIDTILGSREQRKDLTRLICNLINGSVQDKAIKGAAKKAAMFKSAKLTETEKAGLLNRNVSLKTGKMIKGIWLENPHFTGQQLADECGLSLRTIRNAMPIFASPIDG